MARDTYVKDVNGNSLFEGDDVLYKVRRVSPNHGSWGKFKTKYDGEYWINGIIEFKHNEFFIIANQEDYDDLRQPKGKEQGLRQVWFKIAKLSESIVKRKLNHSVPIIQDRLRILGIKE